jgi:hypothetical protein
MTVKNPLFLCPTFWISSQDLGIRQMLKTALSVNGNQIVIKIYLPEMIFPTKIMNRTVHLFFQGFESGHNSSKKLGVS